MRTLTFPLVVGSIGLGLVIFAAVTGSDNAALWTAGPSLVAMALSAEAERRRKNGQNGDHR